MRRGTHDRRSRGFTVLEATIALTVVTIVAGSVLWSGARETRGAAAAFHRAQAVRAAESLLERARADALRAGRDAVELPPGDAPRDARASRDVREVEPGLYEVTASVRWNEPGDEVEREERLTTWVAREDAR